MSKPLSKVQLEDESPEYPFTKTWEEQAKGTGEAVPLERAWKLGALSPHLTLRVSSIWLVLGSVLLS